MSYPDPAVRQLALLDQTMPLPPDSFDPIVVQRILHGNSSPSRSSAEATPLPSGQTGPTPSLQRPRTRSEPDPSPSPPPLRPHPPPRTVLAAAPPTQQQQLTLRGRPLQQQHRLPPLPLQAPVRPPEQQPATTSTTRHPMAPATDDTRPLRAAPQVVSWNIRSLGQRKLNHLDPWLGTPDTTLPDVLCLQEVGHLPVECSAWLTNHGSWFHTPRAEANGQHGGVGILVNKNVYTCERVASYSSAELIQSPAAFVDYVIVEITDIATEEVYRVASVYCPPGGTMQTAVLLDALFHTHRVDVVAGDWNARHRTWSPAPEGGSLNAICPQTAARGQAILTWCVQHGVHMSNMGIAFAATRPRDGTAVDFILCHRSIQQTTHVVLPLEGGDLVSDHRPVALVVPTRQRRLPARRVRHLRWDRITEEVHRPLAQRLLRRLETPEQLSGTFRRLLAPLPHSALRPSRMVPSRREEWDTAIHSDIQAWKRLAALYTEVPPLLPLQDVSTGARFVTPKAKADALNERFLGKHSLLTPPGDHWTPHRPLATPPDETPPSDDDDAPPCRQWEVREAISTLKAAGAPDNAGVTPKFMKWLGEDAVVALTRVFTQILKAPARIPADWKQATFIPLAKPGKDPRDLNSFRPVSITSQVGRLCERVMLTRIAAHVLPKLHPRQYGFRPGCSVSDAQGDLLGFAHLITSTTFQRKGQTGNRIATHGLALAVYLDLTDAFCRMPPQLMLDRLAALGAPRYALRFVWHWLYGRTARTFVHGRFSSYGPILAGVLQGSVLGPLLFVTFIDHVVQQTSAALRTAICGHQLALHAIVVSYVDDIAIAIGGGTDATAIVKLASHVLAIVARSCQDCNMVLSTKSVAQWLLRSAHSRNLLGTAPSPPSPGRVASPREGSTPTTPQTTQPTPQRRQRGRPPPRLAPLDPTQTRLSFAAQPPPTGTAGNNDLPPAGGSGGALRTTTVAPPPLPPIAPSAAADPDQSQPDDSVTTALPSIFIPVVLPDTHPMAVPFTNAPESFPHGTALVLPTTLATTRYLGIMVDYKLSYHDHVALLQSKGVTMLAKIRQISKQLHPRVGRTLALATASVITYGAAPLYGVAKKVFLDNLTSTYVSAVKAGGNIVRTAANADALIQMGCKPLHAHMLALHVSWLHKRHTRGLTSLVEPVFERLGTVAADRPTVVIPPHSRPVDLVGEGLAASPIAPETRLLPFLSPSIPPPVATDKVQFLVCKGKTMTDEEKRARNGATREVAYHRMSGLTVIEGWCDGSWSPATRDHPERAGAAAVVFAEGRDHCNPHPHAPTRAQIAVPPLSCSYTAEVFAARALLQALLAVVQAVKQDDSEARIGVLLCSDSQSWITHVMRGPSRAGPLCTMLWSCLSQLAESASCVVISHMYAHCADPRGDYVDRLATEAAKANARITEAWHVDATRHYLKMPLQAIMQTTLLARSTFHKAAWPRLQAVSFTVANLPPSSLEVRKATYIMQICTGYWPRLGTHTYIMSELRETVCSFCREIIPAVRGGAVLHLLRCRQRTHREDGPQSKSTAALERFLEWARAFSLR